MTLTANDSTRFLDAVNRLTLSAIEGEIVRAKYECYGCSHPRHSANACEVLPRFTTETRCACPGELP